ncbi:MAG: hypothetical protein ACW99G_04725 [Candidatus Thorarchaeota archaeon]|jgi:hypothetical protein
MKGAKRQKIGEGDKTEPIHVSIQSSTLKKLDDMAEREGVTRSLLIGVALKRMLRDGERGLTIPVTETPRSDRFLSKEDEHWLRGRIDLIKAKAEVTELQEIHARDILRYVSGIGNWYENKDIRDFVVLSLREPLAEEVQSVVLSLLGRALAFARWKGDMEHWKEWLDETFPTMKKVVLEREWSLELRKDLFKSVIASEILLGYEDEPMPDGLLDFVREVIVTFDGAERDGFSLANYLSMMAERNEDNARNLRRVFLDLYEDNDVDVEAREFLRRLMMTKQFEGL